jgi:putative heme-binding domain-containing protein
VAKLGDAARGEAVFRRKDQLCLKCHAIGGAGGQLGPDLTSIGASAQVDYLLESLLEPNKVIKENYHSQIVTLKDGRELIGIKVRQSDTELILRNAEDREIAIPRNKIDETRNGPSLMPDGLTDPLTRGELLDLVRFLSELGKVGPYSLSKARLVRRWQTLTPTKDVYTPLYRVGFEAVTTDDPVFVWEPAYTTVAGSLPLSDVPRIEMKKADTREPYGMAFVRFQLDATTPGPVRLNFGSAKGLRLWLGKTPVAVQDTTTLDVPAGLQTLTLAVDLTERKEPLRCELDDAPGSPARVRVVGGK